MFRASMCPSSGENYCIYGALVFVNQQNIKFGNAKLAKSTYQYKNIKTKLYKTLMRQSGTIRHAFFF